MKILNSKGNVYYGMHFYPGVAEYRDEPGKDPYRIFINEDTIRAMGPTFAGRPIFVEHVNEVEQDRDELRKEADGWVLESFFNAADGKHWAKFLVVSDRGEEAIRKGYKLSNAYIPRAFGAGGLWNGVDYAKEVTSGEFEHLAIVRNPRYEESRIFTPDEFKQYNEEKMLELKKLANSNDEKKESSKMKLNFFKRAKVENSIDLDGMHVTLPKSKKEVAIEKLVNDADEMEMNAGKEVMANGDHQVMVGEKKMSVNDLLAAHKAMNDELDLLKDKKPADESGAKDPDVESMDNEEDEEAKKKALELAEHEEKEIVEAKKKNDEDEAKAASEEKKKNAAEAKAKGQEHFEALKNARETASEEVAPMDLSEDRVARGKARYGS